MKSVRVRVIQFSFLALLGVFITGCIPKINPEERGLPPSARVPAAGEGDDFGLVGPGTGPWGDVGSAYGDGGLGPDGLAPNEARWEGVAVYFGYNRATIGISEQHKVEALGKHLIEHPGYYVVVEGHCDERGSDEYNRALGERRALAVHDYLVTLGIDANRIRTISYGEERPAVPDATSEEMHAKNRRAEFILGAGQ